MSQRNAQVLRAAYARAAALGVEGMLEFVTEDVVWISDPRFPGEGTHEGEENVRRWLTQLWIYEELSIDVEEIIDPRQQGAGDHSLPRCAPERPQSGLGVVPSSFVRGWADQPGAELPR